MIRPRSRRFRDKRKHDGTGGVFRENPQDEWGTQGIRKTKTAGRRSRELVCLGSEFSVPEFLSS